MTDEPWRHAFEAARDPYAARNALGVASDGGITRALADSLYLPKLGITDGSTAAVGNVGELKSSSQLTPQVLTTVTVLSLAQITLLGEWEIQGAIGISGNVATTVKYAFADISSVVNTLNNTLDHTATQFFNNNTIFNLLSPQFITTPRFTVNVSSSTTYNINAYVDFAVNTCSAIGKIWARRIR